MSDPSTLSGSWNTLIQDSQAWEGNVINEASKVFKYRDRYYMLYNGKGTGDPNYAIFDQSWFRDSNDPNILDPDYFDAVRLSSYSQWLYDTIPPVLTGDLNGDDYVDFSDFAVFARYWLSYDCNAPNWCLGADTEPDGDVDYIDLAEFSYNWLYPVSP